MTRPPRRQPGIPSVHQNRLKAQAALTPDAAAFIAGAPGKDTLPWQQPGVRDNLMVQMHTAQPERLVLVMEWLAAQSGVTKRQWVEDAMRERAERELKAMGLSL